MKKKLDKLKPRKPEDEIVKASEPITSEGTSPNELKGKAGNEETNWFNELNQNKIIHQRASNTLREMWVIGWIVPALMIFLCIFFVIFLGSWSWHFVASDYWQWLEDDQIDKIESTIFSGSLGAVASIYFQGKIKKKSTASDTTSQSE